jgi:hypothetical protein
MKILKIINVNLNLIAIALLFPSFGGAGGGLYAQDPGLFNQTWYFQVGELNGGQFLPTTKLTAKLSMFSNEISYGYEYCEGGVLFEGVIYNADEPLFEITGDHYILIDLCSPDDPNELMFMQQHDLIFGDLSSSTMTYYNPFTYIIETIDDYLKLTITNGEGDWAVYNSVLLSTTSFTQNSFTFYPNPAKEILTIATRFSESFTTNVYDMTGKLLQSQVFATAPYQMNVASLNPGVYFVVFENGTGEWVSKKFVKR